MQVWWRTRRGVPVHPADGPAVARQPSAATRGYAYNRAVRCANRGCLSPPPTSIHPHAFIDWTTTPALRGALNRELMTMATKPTAKDAAKLRSQQWFNNPDNPDMTALYLERYMNWGLKREELQAGKPIIGIAQSGSDLSPCNRHHLVLAERVREGIREAGGIAFEFPVHPIQETGKRPTAALDRNLAYLG